jgi:ubiquinone/menaquinone biosynthesis C-methylase UbiE
MRPRVVDAARQQADQAGAANVRFMVGDVQKSELGEHFDYAFSRFGTRSFPDPVAALRNVRRALRPGGRLCMVVWRRRLDNPWLQRAETVVEQFMTEAEEPDEPARGPGPSRWRMPTPRARS